MSTDGLCCIPFGECENKECNNIFCENCGFVIGTKKDYENIRNEDDKYTIFLRSATKKEIAKHNFEFPVLN